MGTKRSYSSIGDGDVHPDRASRVPGTYAQKKHKPGKPNVGTTDSSQAMKKRTRDIERMLQQKGDALPLKVRTGLDRELAALKERVENLREKKQRSQMISKYHMVRFFERKKAQRLVKRMQKKLNDAKDPEEIDQLKRDLHTAEVDLNYTIYHPFLERYTSLYPNTTDDAASDEKPTAELALRSKRPHTWAEVENAMAGGKTALLRLQERKSGAQPSDASGTVDAMAEEDKKLPESAKMTEKTHNKEKKALDSEKEAKDKQNNKKKTKEAVRADPESEASGDESDMGFFT